MIRTFSEFMAMQVVNARHLEEQVHARLVAHELDIADGTSDGISYGELGVAAYTFELGTSFFQSCSVYEGTIRPDNLPALIYAAKVVRTPYQTPAGPDLTHGPGAADAGRARVHVELLRAAV